MRLTIRFFLLLGLLASLLLGLAEWLLHFDHQGPSGEISMLFDVPLRRAEIGHFLAIAAATLYFAGYYGIMRIFESGSPILARLLFVTGVFSLSTGSIWLSSRYFAAEVLQKTRGTANFDFFLSSNESQYQVWVWALRILISLVSILFIAVVLKNKIGIPKYLAIFNPISLLAFSTLFWARPLGVHIAPIAMNTTHIYLLWNADPIYSWEKQLNKWETRTIPHVQNRPIFVNVRMDRTSRFS